jgi:hypothetical protein
MGYGNFAEMSDLVGKTFVKVKSDDDSVRFYLADGYYELKHCQNCCENVYLADICGDISDMENTQILFAEESSSSSDSEYGITRWTFYNIRTNKGTTTLRFYGESNGYYSVGVDLSYYPSPEEDSYTSLVPSEITTSTHSSAPVEVSASTDTATVSANASLDGTVLEINGTKYRLTKV